MQSFWHETLLFWLDSQVIITKGWNFSHRFFSFYGILDLILYYISYSYCVTSMMWAQNAKDILMPCLILNRSPCLLSGYDYRECIITVFFGLCSSWLPLNALVILRWILWFIMFWILIIVLIISVQTCKLVQAINLRF